MKILKVSIPILMATFFLLTNFSYSSNVGDMRISFMEGDVQFRQSDSSEFVPATANTPLNEGSALYVPKGGKAEVQLRDGTCLRLNEDSALQIVKGEKNFYRFNFQRGDIYINFKKSSDTEVQVRGPGPAVVRIYDRATFSKNVSKDGEVEVSVLDGTVNVETVDVKDESSQDITINKGQAFSLAEKPPGPFEIENPDDWEKWNAERDKKTSSTDRKDRGTSVRDSAASKVASDKVASEDSESYLPDELRSYSKDFDDNGRWINVKEYGRVWSPAVSSSQWAPYKDGRWTWIGEDYVWVSYEPWGWAPYHYGRWVNVQGIGWGWVPPKKGEVYWGPGFVGWVSTPTHVAWVPLAPGEIYYGYGVYGPHSVDIRTNKYINVTKIVYKNVRVSNAVTVVTPTTFRTGQHEEVKVRGGDVFRQVHLGRPMINPEKATMMPVVRDIPQDKRPPQQVVDLKVEQLEKSYPLVRDRNSSVLRPGSPLKKMEVKALGIKREERRVEREKRRYEGKADGTSSTEKRGERPLRRRERESQEGKAEGFGRHEKQSDGPGLRPREREDTSHAEKERGRKDRFDVEGKGGQRENLEEEGHKKEQQKGKLFDPSEIFGPKKNRAGQKDGEGTGQDQTDKSNIRKSRQQDEEKAGRQQKKKQGTKRTKKRDDD